MIFQHVLFVKQDTHQMLIPFMQFLLRSSHFCTDAFTPLCYTLAQDASHGTSISGNSVWIKSLLFQTYLQFFILFFFQPNLTDPEKTKSLPYSLFVIAIFHCKPEAESPTKPFLLSICTLKKQTKTFTRGIIRTFFYHTMVLKNELVAQH